MIPRPVAAHRLQRSRVVCHANPRQNPPASGPQQSVPADLGSARRSRLNGGRSDVTDEDVNGARSSIHPPPQRTGTHRATRDWPELMLLTNLLITDKDDCG
jgi:hypothetical protein